MIVLTAGYGPHAELMRLTEKHHRRWAEKIGASHMLRYGPEPWPGEPRDGCWQKILAIRAVLDGMFEREVLVWIEPDVLVCDLTANPLDVMPKDAEWGMVWRGGERGVNPHFCTGVQIIRNVESVRNLLDEVWDVGPLPGLFPGDCRPTNVVLRGRNPKRITTDKDARVNWPIGIKADEAAAMAFQATGCRIHPIPKTWNVHLKPHAPGPDQQAKAVCLHWSRIEKDVCERRMRETLARVAPPYAPMKRNTPWPHLPTVPQITTLQPALDATEARLAGTPTFECGILFTHHRVDAVTLENMASFERHNHDCVVIPISTEQDVTPGGYRLDENEHWRAITARSGRGAWRNIDWAYWLYYSNRAYNCKRWLCSDWDVHCTGPLSEFYGPAWDADVACARPAIAGVDPFYWFKEVPRLPADLRDQAAALTPMTCTLLSDRAMKTMTAASARMSYDLFCEVRAGTLARACGFDITTIPHPETIRWDRRPEITGRGLWHPVKEAETLPRGATK